MGAEGGHDNGEENSSTITKTRIFVGGLGETVTAQDLRTIFSSLGKVESLEIVRTKGRSFAYLDFLPSSPKSLSKLFSTYNGCIWKGGRLRLEKAKDHYLLRLRREWEEDAKLADSTPSIVVDATENMGSPEKHKKALNLEKMELRLFFPKLRKVKPLPPKGTGKHKYSFQRVEVPALPNHFCDCEEHSRFYDNAKEKNILYREIQDGGIDEKELDIMNSVMKKLFERENILEAASTAAELVKNGDNITESVDDLLVDEKNEDDATGSVDDHDENEIDDMSDEDNLVMNMITGAKKRTARSVDDMLVDENKLNDMSDEENLVMNMVTRTNKGTAVLGSLGHETILAKQGPVDDELQTSKNRPSKDLLKSQIRKNLPSDIKRKSPSAGVSYGKELVSNNPEWKEGAKKGRSHESARAVELDSGSQQPKPSWSQKSTWRDLAGERGNSGFSISQILETAAPTEEPNSGSVDVPHFTDPENQNPVKNTNSENQSSRPKEPEEYAVSQLNELKTASNKYARGASWLQKSSWTQLVSETNSSFSIAQLLPAMTFQKLEQAEPKNVFAANSTDTKNFKLVKSGTCESSGYGSKGSETGKEDSLTAPNSSNAVTLATVLDSKLSQPQTNLQSSGETDEIPASKNNHAEVKRPPVRDIAIGEACTFMRSSASLKEWMKTRAAISGSLKKTKNEK